MTLRSNAVELARVWKGATLRTVNKAKAGGLIEGRRLARVIGLPGADRSTQKVVRALLTGYLLHTLTGDKTYRDFADPEIGPAQSTRRGSVRRRSGGLEDKVVALTEALSQANQPVGCITRLMRTGIFLSYAGGYHLRGRRRGRRAREDRRRHRPGGGGLLVRRDQPAGLSWRPRRRGSSSAPAWCRSTSAPRHCWR